MSSSMPNQQQRGFTNANTSANHQQQSSNRDSKNSRTSNTSSQQRRRDAIAQTRPLYLVLEITPEATPEEVRKAYRRLALRYHPDKAGPESAEKFQQIVAAYTLLSDPDAREVYDRYGEQGLTNLDSVPAMAEVAHAMSAVNFFRVTFAIGAVECALGFIFLVLASIKVDYDKSWSWNTVAAPASTAAFVILVVTIVSMYFRIKKYIAWYRAVADDRKPSFTDGSSSGSGGGSGGADGGRDERCRCQRVGGCGARGFTCSCGRGGGGGGSGTGQQQQQAPQGSPKAGPDAAACQVNKCLILQQVVFWCRHISTLLYLFTFTLLSNALQLELLRIRRPYSWTTVFAPAFVASLLSIVSVGQFRDVLRLRGVHEMCNWMLGIMNILNVCMFGCKVTQIVIVTLALDGHIHWRPFVVGIPSIVYFALRLVNGICLEVSRVRGLNRFRKRRNPLEKEDCRATNLDTGKPVDLGGEDGDDYCEDGDGGEQCEAGGPCHSEWASYKQPSFVIQVGLEVVVHVLLVLSTFLCIGKADGLLDISLSAALSPAYLLLAILFIVCSILYMCFAIYVMTVKDEEKAKRKAEEKEEEERRAARRERRRARARAYREQHHHGSPDGSFRFETTWNEHHPTGNWHNASRHESSFHNTWGAPSPEDTLHGQPRFYTNNTGGSYFPNFGGTGRQQQFHQYQGPGSQGRGNAGGRRGRGRRQHQPNTADNLQGSGVYHDGDDAFASQDDGFSRSNNINRARGDGHHHNGSYRHHSNGTYTDGGKGHYYGNSYSVSMEDGGFADEHEDDHHYHDHHFDDDRNDGANNRYGGHYAEQQQHEEGYPAAMEGDWRSRRGRQRGGPDGAPNTNTYEHWPTQNAAFPPSKDAYYGDHGGEYDNTPHDTEGGVMYGDGGEPMIEIVAGGSGVYPLQQSPPRGAILSTSSPNGSSLNGRVNNAGVSNARDGHSGSSRNNSAFDNAGYSPRAGNGDIMGSSSAAAPHQSRRQSSYRHNHQQNQQQQQFGHSGFDMEISPLTPPVTVYANTNNLQGSFATRIPI